MSFRRRHRWTRRFLLGLAFGLAAVPAQAASLATGPGHDDSAVAAAQAVSDPYLTDIPSRPETVAAAGPDGTGVATSSGSVRPDDRGERFTVTGGQVPQASESDGFAVDWSSGITIGLVALGLGIAAAALRRPRVAL